MTPRRARDDAEDRAVRSPAEEREDALARVMRRARESADARRARVHAQKGEPLWKTGGRVLYLSLAVIVDGPVLLEIVRRFGGSVMGWALYALALFVAVALQVKLYRRWFTVQVD